MKSRLSRSPGCRRMVSGEPSPTTTLCKLLRMFAAPEGMSAESNSTSSDSRTGLGKPGSSTGGVTREASGTWSVSVRRSRADGGTIERNAGRVARRNHQREAKRGLAGGNRQRSHERELHGGVFVRREVAHAQREHAAALLLGDRGAVPGLNGLVVLLAGLAGVLEIAFDHAAGHAQREAGSGGAIGQRKDVRGFDRHVERVAECLPHQRFGVQIANAVGTSSATRGKRPRSVSRTPKPDWSIGRDVSSRSGSVVIGKPLKMRG